MDRNFKSVERIKMQHKNAWMFSRERFPEPIIKVSVDNLLKKENTVLFREIHQQNKRANIR